MAEPARPAEEIVSSHFYDYSPSQYIYTFNQGYFDPINDPETVRSSRESSDKEAEIALDADNFRPKDGKTWEDVVLCQREQKDAPETRLIYVTRHGRTGHNEAQERFGKAIYYKYLAFDDEYLDPALSDVGIAQAKAAGNMVAEAVHQGAPIPTAVFTSSLRRCPQTALFMTREITSHFPQQEDPIKMFISDKLREWVGINHKHTSDRRSCGPDIVDYMQDFGQEYNIKDVIFSFDHPFPANDAEFELDVLVESHTEVVRRMRAALDTIFEQDDECVHVVLHNCSFMAFARAIGHMDPPKDGMNIANGATIPFLVSRSELSPEAVQERQFGEEHLIKEELVTLAKEKEIVFSKAAKMVEELPPDIYEELKEKVRKLGGDLDELERDRKGSN